MPPIPAPSITLSREEWPDADFDIPDDDEPLHASDVESDRDDDADWDADMGLGGKKGAVRALGVAARSQPLRKGTSQMITIRPPVLPSTSEDDEDDEGFSTIKIAALPKPSTSSAPSFDDDFEDAFALPSDLTQLSLKPLSLHHQSSKNSLEWGEKDQTSSSQSSDAYSTLGFAEGSPSSSNSTSASLPETDDDEDDGDLEGLVIPSGLFDGAGGKHLVRLLEKKKRAPVADEGVKVASPDPEDDYESGLVIDDDADFSPSRLLQKSLDKHPKLRSTLGARSNSMPARPLSVRPQPRLTHDRAKSPIDPPASSARQMQKIKLSPPLSPTTRSDSFKALLSAPAAPGASSSSFLAAKSGSLRGQKSHTGLNPPAQPTTQRALTRKASMGALMGSNQAQASGSGSTSKAAAPNSGSRYEAPTAASRAKNSHTHSTSRMHGLERYDVPPTRPSTPNPNPAALRLTMPTSSARLKTRPLISNVFPSSSSSSTSSSIPPRARSPMPPRPPSSASTRSRSAAVISPPPPPHTGPKVLRKPKRQRMYGDGTELDAFEDLPTDRDKESRYRVQPKGYGNRVPGAMYPSKGYDGKDWGKGTMRRKPLRDGSGSGSDASRAAESRTLKRTGRIDFPSRSGTLDSTSSKRIKATPSSPNQTRRKPTLIRNLGGATAPKVVGEMKWNPQTLRWEGNDQALRDFDAAIGTSTRPALITHLTGSSVGSPVSSFASGARRVGNMIFDPNRMCWISTLPPEEDEPDVFADLADDEEDGWEANGGTIRAGQQQQNPTASGPVDSSKSSAASRSDPPSPTRSTRSHTRSPSESGSDRGSRASMVCDVDDTFLDACRQAEERHRNEMKGWKMKQDNAPAGTDRQYLFDIRALATGDY